MKAAKKNAFLGRQHRHFHVYVQNHSKAERIPAVRDFYRWMWQACKDRFGGAEISVLLCNTEEARIFNRDYRNKDYATNVLSFALDEGDAFSAVSPGSLNGDVVFCTDVVEREAAEQGKTLESHYAHLTVHAALHLSGYDHIDESDAEIMESLEKRILHQLGYADPYQQDEY